MKRAENSFDQAPKGSLNYSKSNGCIQYYQSLEGKERIYISSNDKKLVSALAQKDYDRQFIKVVNKEIINIKSVLEKLYESRLVDVYSGLNELRKTHVSPYILTDEQYIDNWLGLEYKGKELDDDVMEIITERGERVRSKSEKIIADKLFSLGIPYRYECPLKLKGVGVIYPDFTLLNINTREEIYLEHFGMMDKEDYCQKAISKIASYEKNGIYIGERLLVTFETSNQMLDMRTFERKLRDMNFCR